MKARPAWVRRVITSLWLAVALVMVAALYLYFKVTAEADTYSLKEPNALDAREANRKLGLYKKALEGPERSGFIRLSEVEINSYLRERYFADQAKSLTNAPDSVPRLLESRVKLSGQEILWYCWVQKKWCGVSVPMVWRRNLELARGTNSPKLATKSMTLGKLEVPLRYWPFVNRELGEVDRVFAEDRRWVEKLPRLEIRTNNQSAAPELRLYTHSTAASSAARSP